MNKLVGELVNAQNYLYNLLQNDKIRKGWMDQWKTVLKTNHSNQKTTLIMIKFNLFSNMLNFENIIKKGYADILRNCLKKMYMWYNN